MARLPGSVQGVVVQITMLASLTAAMIAAEASLAGSEFDLRDRKLHPHRI